MSVSLRNLENTLTALLKALDNGTYRTEPEHIKADLTYLLAEVRSAIWTEAIEADQ